MGRGKAPEPPQFSPSEIRYGNNVVGRTYQDPTGAIISQYFPDPLEAERRTLLQQKLNSIAPSLGLTAPELAQQYNQTEAAYVDDAKTKFLDQYNPTLRDLREDIASRFGTLNSSQFLNGLTDLEKTKASAFADIVNQGKMLKYDLVNQDETRKLNAMQALSGLLNGDVANFMNGVQAPQSSANLINGLSNNQWVNMLNDYRQSIANNKNTRTSQNNNKWYSMKMSDLF
ncbi:MAG: hypothetical protein A2287_07155 [Candidatus Melainabacteria bacterium RIFOXYA12_FULL_32_12]|nr:MAG: hypothetical protein A2255_00095 [Candidatus Melainabacteria bacterium RIFOXYA2_FULL_32_9]OGI26991.1 MAG: hypothetical protein A2287_07155 [Candidatus Melainabacteria bacterium RIFOXYA12_FULL_32_12]